VAARGVVMDKDPVAGPEIGDPLPHRHHDAGGLVAEDEGRPGRHVPVQGIATAQTASLHLHQGFPGADGRHRHGADGRPAGAFVEGGQHGVARLGCRRDTGFRHSNSSRGRPSTRSASTGTGSRATLPPVKWEVSRSNTAVTWAKGAWWVMRADSSSWRAIRMRMARFTSAVV